MSETTASIITIGDELLIGQTIDTNSAFIAQELNKAGIWAKRRVAVGDDYDEIWAALNEESNHANLVIITGGLGPTADDITKPLLCKYFGGKLVRNQQVLAHIQHLFENVYQRKGTLSEANIKQADLPDVCTVLHNEVGSASGMWFEKVNKVGKKNIFIAMPGVPHEMKKMFAEIAIPKLKKAYTVTAIVHETAITFGMGESSVAELLSGFESKLPPHIKLAYLPGFGMVKLRLTGRGHDEAVLKAEVSILFKEMVKILQHIVIAETDDPMEVLLGRLLLQNNYTVATAESCTGGYIAHLLTNIAGSSNYFKGSVVAYANEVKQNILDVENVVLTNEGAVSEATVKQMVLGAINKLNSDFAIATSGIMGPGGGTAEKPVGTVWIAAGNKDRIDTKLLHLRFDRDRNIKTTALQALNLLRQVLVSKPVVR